VKTFIWGNIHFRENAYLFRKFQAIFVRKKPYTLFLLGLITPASLRQPAQQRITIVGGSWDVFKKRMLVEKHIIGIMFKNTGGHGPPSADARD